MGLLITVFLGAIGVIILLCIQAAFNKWLGRY